MRKILVTAAAVVIAVASFGLVSPQSAAADGYPYNAMHCKDDKATVTVSWVPLSGALEQWVEVSLYQGFGSTYSVHGPYGPAVHSDTWEDLDSAYTYFWRIKTKTAGGWVYSPVFVVYPCDGIPAYSPYPVYNLYPAYAPLCHPYGYYGYPYYPYKFDSDYLSQQGIAYHLGLLHGGYYYPYPYFGSAYCAAGYIGSYLYHHCAAPYYPGPCYIWEDDD